METLNTKLYGIIEGLCLENAPEKLSQYAKLKRKSQPEYIFHHIPASRYPKGELTCHCKCRFFVEGGAVRAVYASTEQDAKNASAYLVLIRVLNLPNAYGNESDQPYWFFADGRLTTDENRFL